MNPSVNIRRFELEDYGQLKKWCIDREVGVPQIECLSELGLIVDGVACGFLYLTNSAVGLLEAFYANPDADKIDRDLALNSITLELIEMAVLNGCKVLKCETKLDAISKRAIEFGFIDVGNFKTLMKEIV
jgi:hypothetical protein